MSVKNSIAKLVLRLFNVAIITIAILLVGLAVRRYRVAQISSRMQIPAYFKAGAQFPVQGLDWSNSNQTLVIILEQSCALCSQSAPFYRFIEQNRTGPGQARLIALVGDDLIDIDAYLQKLQLSFDEVKPVSLRALKPYGLTGTPTVVLVNEQGLVTNIWPGTLTELQQSEVLRALRIGTKDSEVPPSASSSLVIIDQAELKRLKNAGQKLTVVDLRDRDPFSEGHPAGAKNIPIDELAIRAINELDASDLIVLYGGENSSNLYVTGATILRREGFMQLRGLQISKPSQ